ncbi:Tc toxin subunit A-related protein [Actinacidiphila glaucinigra]|uniref:Tc toxin subunit A-related protein n=1 Tax=Actinacidiphila glaucinigra TaxID=235986 RepID=UPI0035DD5867
MNGWSAALQGKRFHGHQDSEVILFNYLHAEKTETTKYLIVQERELGYRFHPHFHPYADRLSQELRRSGLSALQAADTLYTPNGASLPGSVVLGLPEGAAVSLPAGTPLAMTEAVQAKLPGGGTIELSGHLMVRVAAPNAAVTAPAGTTVTLPEGLTPTPASGSDYAPGLDKDVHVRGDTMLALAAETAVLLQDGSAATLPEASLVVLPAGESLTVPSATRKTVLSSRPRPELYEELFTAARYQPGDLVRRPYPVKDLDFDYGGAYAVYNWELFFHVPFTMAVHLSHNQRFAEAQQWFHLLFDPLDDSDGPTPERFWKVRPFQQTDVRKIEEILVNLTSKADPDLREQTLTSIAAWKRAPFRPHVIARYRQQAYMYKTVMAYLDNLIAWGDSLFRQDTGEAIDEALMLYVLAANILGPRPQPVPGKGSVRPQTYHNLRADLRQFGTAMRDIEADLGFDLMPFPGEDTVDTVRLATVRSLGKTPYFGIPANTQLLTYWDTVSDRLFKIRNSLDLQGRFRQVALFAPPINPAMLARAAASGLDVGAIVSGVNQPLPLVRFQFLVHNAAEICQEVRSLGANLLSIMEKEDAEALTILRSKHEQAITRMTEDTRYTQLQEATKAKEGLLKSLALTIQRYAFYERQLGRTPEEVEKAVPALEELDRDSLAARKFAMTEPEVAPRDIEIDNATDLFAQAAQLLAGGRILSSHEVRETLFLDSAQIALDIANGISAAGTAAGVIPQFSVDAKPWGMGGGTTFGGQNIGAVIQAFAQNVRGVGERLSFEARRANRIDGFARREREWAFQSNLAAGEITQIFKQLRAAQLREAIAEQELAGHRQQMKHAKEVEEYLNEFGTERTGKATNKALYAWMRREAKALYAQCFQFAFDIARKAERALQHELGRPDLTFLQFGYLAGKEGLLAGEKLHLDIKRMEMVYHDLNQREYELTKHVSLLDLDPMALIRLRRTGRATIRLPEALFDLDGPGHYFRRIRSIALSVPSVTGPYTGVHCTLSLLKSSVRTSPVLRDGGYARVDADDDRFSDHLGAIESVATSSGQNDSGLFEPNSRADRLGPFEYAGLISELQIELPADPTKNDPLPFDFGSISDIVLHIRYTAREGGGLLRREAIANLKTLLQEGTAPGCVRMLSARHEFASSWSRFHTDVPKDEERHVLRLPLGPEHFPFLSRDRLTTAYRVLLVGRSSAAKAPATMDVFGTHDSELAVATLTEDVTLGGLMVGELTAAARPTSPAQEITFYFDSTALADLWVLVTWGG